jgi:hypothetical protein
MAKEKARNVQQRGQASGLAAEPESGLGNLSAEEMAALQGVTVDVVADGETAVTSTSELTRGTEASPEQVSLGARMATLEAKLGDIEKAMERWSDRLNAQIQAFPMQRQSQEMPVSIRAATVAEEAAYCRQNFEMQTRGDKPFNGIQDWRDQGSPGLDGA